MMDKVTGRSRGFGFVCFCYPNSKYNAVGMHQIGGQQVEAKICESKERMAASRGSYPPTPYYKQSPRDGQRDGYYRGGSGGAYGSPGAAAYGAPSAYSPSYAAPRPSYGPPPSYGRPGGASDPATGYDGAYAPPYGAMEQGRPYGGPSPYAPPAGYSPPGGYAAPDAPGTYNAPYTANPPTPYGTPEAYQAAPYPYYHDPQQPPVSGPTRSNQKGAGNARRQTPY
eukprot:GHVT01088135.1.p1 GENE.GHVT01088135.1~~GHVT01088135.1.p1  ORF type:complete len:225 (+),score=41.48 GHVT01088135.1:284-958(+)